MVTREREMNTNGRETATAGMLVGTLAVCGCAGHSLSPVEEARRTRERELYLVCLHEQAPAAMLTWLGPRIRASCRNQARRAVRTVRR